MKSSRLEKFIFTVCAVFFILESAGCQSLARKFVRKPKNQDKKTETVVFAPEEYKGEGESSQELYRQYYLYWRTWHEELINSLEKSGNRKKQFDSLDEAVKNLENMKALLISDKAEKIDFWIKQLQLLAAAINKDIYSQLVANNRSRAEWIKREIMREYAFKKIKDSIQ